MTNHNQAPRPDRREITDLSLPIPMFDGATIVELGNRRELHVPTRTLRTEKYGTWTLDIHGHTKWFKEHDDYGSHRVTESGNTLWIPHVYGLEETNQDTNMPTFVDEERMKIVVALELQSGETVPNDIALIIETDESTLTAMPNTNYYYSSYPYGSYLYFNEFEDTAAPLYTQQVTLLENEQYNPNFLEDFILEHGIDAIQSPDFTLPPHSNTRYLHDDFTKRIAANFPDSRHFGELWVPVSAVTDETMHADIHLPMFNNEMTRPL